MSYLSSLKCSAFRSYSALRLEGLSNGLLVLHGKNGAGKTNILEAISLLVPGRGLRSARNSDIQSQQAGTPWAVAADVETDYGTMRIGTGLDPAKDKRTVRINGETASAQSALADHLACVWLTPQMDRLFLDAATHRRKFLDRLIFAFDPGHAGRVARYDNALAQRSKLLRDGRNEPSWIASLEGQMVEAGVAIAATRLQFVSRLQKVCENHQSPYFPLAGLRAAGTIEELLTRVPATEVEDIFAHQLSESRPRDALTGGAMTGPHKGDLEVRYTAKNMAADQCSTGEQKALLIGLVIAHARLITAERGAPPVLLLDEVAAHLDENRRAALYDLLIDLGGQVWLTGTDENLFTAIEGRAQFHHVRDGGVF